MAEVKVEIKGDAEAFRAACKEAEKSVRNMADNIARDTAKASEQVQQQAKRSAENVSKAGSALSAIGSQIGGVFGKAGQVISAMVSGPIAAVTAAIGIVVTTAMKLYDALTLSREEMAALQEFRAGVAGQNVGNWQKQTQTDSGYMSRLAELAKNERLSNVQKEEAASLIATLTQRYGELGVSVDQVTGKITGMDAAQSAFAEKSFKELQRRRNQQANEQEKLADSKTYTAFDQYVHWYTPAPDQYKQRDQYLKQFKSSSNEEKITFTMKMIEGSKTNDERKMWEDVYNSLVKVRDIREDIRQGDESYKAGKAKRTTEQDAGGWANKQKQEIELQRMIVEGREQEAEELRTLNELRAQGVTIDEKTVAKVREVLAERRKLTEEQKEANREKALNQELKNQSLERIAMDKPADLAEERQNYITARVKRFEATNGKLSDDDRARYEKSLGETFDKKQKTELNDRMKSFQKELEVKQLELKGLHEESSLLKMINAEEEKKGRALTDQEKTLLQTQNHARFQIQDMLDEQARKDAGHYDNPRPYNRDALINMGERVNTVTAINYPQKTYMSIEKIQNTVNGIFAKMQTQTSNNVFS